MAAGDLYIIQDRVYKRDVDNNWTEETAYGRRPGTQAACLNQEGELIVARGTSSDPRLNTFRNNAWVRTDIDGTSRPGIPQGIGVDSNDKIYVGVTNKIFTIETIYPYITPDPISGQNLSGMSVNQHTGEIAYCSSEKVFERALTDTTWTDISPPTSVVSGTRFSQSAAYGHEGELWVYSLIQQRYYVRDSDGNWASGIQVPTTIGSRTVSRTGVLASAIDQGVAALKNLKIGGDNIDAMKIGTEDITAIYLGDTKVWGQI